MEPNEISLYADFSSRIGQRESLDHRLQGDVHSKINRLDDQTARNQALLRSSACCGEMLVSSVIPFRLSSSHSATISGEEQLIIEAIQREAACTALRTAATLGQIGEYACLGGALEIISALSVTLSLSDGESTQFTIENAHTALGYYALLSSFGFFSAEEVAHGFRRGISFPGHVTWVPGGTPLNGGRLGVMIPCAVGYALGQRASRDADAWMVVHCGDAGWISGQALNGFNAASLHRAPVTFVMQRNGLQHTGPTAKVMARDPRSVVAALGVEIIEIPSLHDIPELLDAYREARKLAVTGRPSLIYPVGYQSDLKRSIDLQWFGSRYGILDDVRRIAARHSIPLATPVWVPGSLMSFRDGEAMVENLLLVNDLPGGKSHHDGSFIGRDLETALNGPLCRLEAEHQSSLRRIRSSPPLKIVTRARPEKGKANLVLPVDPEAETRFPQPGERVSVRRGAEISYEALAISFPERFFVVSCDLDLSTKLRAATRHLNPRHSFELGIEEQAAALLANGIAMAVGTQSLTVMSTFAAFFEGIAREGVEMWRYQRNLTGVYEGVNVTFHLSHVGSATGRDHFSGWGLDWINMAISVLPYLDRFYAPADARAAFIAVRDLAARYGAHIVGVPREPLPILNKQGSSEPLWKLRDTWEPTTIFRHAEGADRVIVVMGAPASLCEEAFNALVSVGVATDVIVINGLPLGEETIPSLFLKYPGGIVTVEDGLIGCNKYGWRGLAGIIASLRKREDPPMVHLGITDPTIAPSDGCDQTWFHFGLTAQHVFDAVCGLN